MVVVVVVVMVVVVSLVAMTSQSEMHTVIAGSHPYCQIVFPKDFFNLNVVKT